MIFRGELYRVHNPANDPKRYRMVVVVSRQRLLESSFPSAVCAPVFSQAEGLESQVAVGIDEGLKHDSWIFCDSLFTYAKSQLTDFVGRLGPAKLKNLNEALKVALELGH